MPRPPAAMAMAHLARCPVVVDPRGRHGAAAPATGTAHVTSCTPTCTVPPASASCWSSWATCTARRQVSSAGSARCAAAGRRPGLHRPMANRRSSCAARSNSGCSRPAARHQRLGHRVRQRIGHQQAAAVEVAAEPAQRHLVEQRHRQRRGQHQRGRQRQQETQLQAQRTQAIAAGTFKMHGHKCIRFRHSPFRPNVPLTNQPLPRSRAKPDETAARPPHRSTWRWSATARGCPGRPRGAHRLVLPAALRQHAGVRRAAADSAQGLPSEGSLHDRARGPRAASRPTTPTPRCCARGCGTRRARASRSRLRAALHPPRPHVPPGAAGAARAAAGRPPAHPHRSAAARRLGRHAGR
jgi:hypothetical protein